MMELDAEAKEAGITVMNEIGVDPGVDHLSAVLTIDEVHKAGGKILSFKSYCGGLPAPENSDNPLGYKFSWSSRGVLLALRNQAKYYWDGQIKEVEGPELMAEAKPYFIYPGYAFVAYPNRDSTPYKERYNIPEAQTIVRGTLRYGGFPEYIKCLVDIGFLSEDPKDFLKEGEKRTWRDATAKIVGASSDKDEDLIWAISSRTKFASTEEKERIISGLTSTSPLVATRSIPSALRSSRRCSTRKASVTSLCCSTGSRSRTRMAARRSAHRRLPSMVTPTATQRWPSL
jgi:saccharopine dehydrogenase (NADP+, L-glutamate forming)